MTSAYGLINLPYLLTPGTLEVSPEDAFSPNSTIDEFFLKPIEKPGTQIKLREVANDLEQQLNKAASVFNHGKEALAKHTGIQNPTALDFNNILVSPTILDKIGTALDTSGSLDSDTEKQINATISLIKHAQEAYSAYERLQTNFEGVYPEPSAPLLADATQANQKLIKATETLAKTLGYDPGLSTILPETTNNTAVER